MDKLYSVSNFVTQTTLEVQATESMRGYLSDLKTFNQFTPANEADTNIKLNEWKTAIGKFMENAKRRILEIIDNVIKRLGEMVGALGNMTQVKSIAVPDEMFKAYSNMCAPMDKLSDRTERYVANLLQLQRDMNMRKGDPNPIRTVVNEERERTKDLVEEVKKIKEADVLQGRSVDEYISDKLEPNGRNSTICPAKEQLKLSNWRRKWNSIRSRMKSAAYQTDSNIIYAEIEAGNDQTRLDGLKAYRSIMSDLYNQGMQKVTGVLSIISLLQRYVSGFVMINKKYPPAKEIVDYQGAGALPAHNG